MTTLTRTGVPAHVWSTEEKRILVRAARQAPGRWLGDEWTLSIHGDTIDLFERLEDSRWLRDRGGRARLIACGAVLAHLENAIRVLGWSPRTDLSADVLALDRVARITASARKRPETADFVRFAAMSGRSSLPGPTGVASWGRKIAEGCAVDGVRAGWLAPRRVRALPRVAGQISRKASAAGKDQDDSWSVFLVGSATEVRHQLVRAGVVAQRLRLAATEHGLLSCVCTEPFDTPGVRGSLFGLGGVPGFPQLVVIVGEHQKVPAQKENPS